MNAIQELFKNSASWTTVIFVVLVLLFAIKEIISVISYICEKFGIKTKRITEKENFEKRVNKLEQHDERQYNKLNELCNSINDIKATIVKNEEERKSDVVASYRSTLYRLHENFMKNGYVTSSGLKTFVECGKRYEKCGGDDIYHEKLYPEVLSLPVKNQEE